MPLAAPDNTRPPKDAHAIDASALGAWLATAVPGTRGGRVTVRKFKGGQSNPTYWVGVEGGAGGDAALVVRKKPPGKLLPSAHAVEREYRVMRALGATDVPVPEALALCTDDTIIGTPFFVMRYVPATIFWDPLLTQLPSDDARARVYRDYVETLAKLHRVDYGAVGLADYGKVGGYFGRQVERWSKQYEASRTEDLRSMEALMAWLRGKTPSDDATTLIHGDYRIDNLLYGDDGKIVAVVDWELSTLGHPISDLAYACMGYHLNLPGRGGLAGVDVEALGIPTEQEMVDAYCEVTRSRIADWPMFMAFGIFRLAAIAQGVYKRGLEGNASSDEAHSYGAAVKMLADLACGIAGIATA